MQDAFHLLLCYHKRFSPTCNSNFSLLVTLLLQVAISKFDQNHFINYEKLESSLDVVRNRYALIIGATFGREVLNKISHLTLSRLLTCSIKTIH